MILPITLAITDDTGFLAIVNSGKYQSFVDNNWELPQLFNHFKDEMNADNLIIWATGHEKKWVVTFLDKASTKTAFREFSKIIRVTNKKLYLTNYEDLAMAAQFREEKIPQKHNTELCINLDNGRYNFIVRQLFEPGKHDDDMTSTGTSFEIIIQPNSMEQEPKIHKIFWSTE